MINIQFAIEQRGYLVTTFFLNQIRVWGAKAQLRIQNSKVLVCGFRGLHPEVVKNVVLAGVSVTIQDSTVATMEDLGKKNDFKYHRLHPIVGITHKN